VDLSMRWGFWLEPSALRPFSGHPRRCWIDCRHQRRVAPRRPCNGSNEREGPENVIVAPEHLAWARAGPGLGTHEATRRNGPSPEPAGARILLT
jgi:hypothetical protein